MPLVYRQFLNPHFLCMFLPRHPIAHNAQEPSPSWSGDFCRWSV